jgi:hypothetical protein
MNRTPGNLYIGQATPASAVSLNIWIAKDVPILRGNMIKIYILPP